MPTRPRVFRNQEEDRTLFELRTATTVSQKVFKHPLRKNY